MRVHIFLGTRRLFFFPLTNEAGLGLQKDSAFALSLKRSDPVNHTAWGPPGSTPSGPTRQLEVPRVRPARHRTQQELVWQERPLREKASLTSHMQSAVSLVKGRSCRGSASGLHLAGHRSTLSTCTSCTFCLQTAPHAPHTQTPFNLDPAPSPVRLYLACILKEQTSQLPQHGRPTTQRRDRARPCTADPPVCCFATPG